MFAVPAPVYGVVLDRITAIVNDDVITQSEVYAYGELKLSLEGLPERENALQKRIDHHLVLQQLSRQPPVEIDEEDIQSEIHSFVANHGGKEAASRFLGSIGMSDSDLEMEIRDQVTVRQFVAFRFRPFVNISLDQANKYYEEIYAPRLKANGQVVPTLADSFDAIQNELIRSQIQERVKDWLEELRNSSNITVKE